MKVVHQFFSLNSSIDIIKISPPKINNEKANLVETSSKRMSLFSKESSSVLPKKLSLNN